MADRGGGGGGCSQLTGDNAVKCEHPPRIPPAGPALLTRYRSYGAGGRPSRNARFARRSRHALARRASSTSGRTPQPEPPLLAYGLPRAPAPTAMSRCGKGTSVVKGRRDSAAVIDIASRLAVALTM